MKVRINATCEQQSESAGSSYNPVSYTHLDVYKRQEDRIRSAAAHILHAQMELETVVDPVSYTHLDVYKRQGKYHRSQNRIGV